MQTLLLKIEGMSCSHCVMRIRKALEGCAGVNNAEVDIASASAIVTGEGMTIAELIRSVEDAGYLAQEKTNNN